MIPLTALQLLSILTSAQKKPIFIHLLRIDAFDVYLHMLKYKTVVI